MIIHRSNDTKKKRKVDTTNNNLILNENSISDISTDNICTNNCDINTNNAVTPNRSTLSAQKVRNPYRKASLPSNPSNTNLVTPIRPSIAQVHNPYKKKQQLPNLLWHPLQFWYHRIKPTIINPTSTLNRQQYQAHLSMIYIRKNMLPHVHQIIIHPYQIFSRVFKIHCRHHLHM